METSRAWELRLLRSSIHFVRKAGAQPAFTAEVDRVAAILRMISGKTRDSPEAGSVASVDLLAPDGFVRFVDLMDENECHRLLSAVESGPHIDDIEKAFAEKHGFDLVSALGYGRPCGEGNCRRWFSGVTTDADFRQLAQLAVGILFLLFGLRPEENLEVCFFVPGPALESLPDWDELPESLRVPYCEFKSRHYDVVARYHQLMAMDDGEPLDQKADTPLAVARDMQAVLDAFPTTLASLESLGTAFSQFLSLARDERTELAESLAMLRGRYRMQMFH